MAITRNPLELYLLKLIDESCKTIQIGLRGMGSPIGPGTVKHLNVDGHDLYEIVVQAQFPKPSAIPGMRPTVVDVLMPMTISPADLLFVSAGPTTPDGKPLDMGGNEPPAKKSPSGIEIA